MLRLGPHVRFRTIYNIFSLEGGSEELCLSQGLYAKYRRLYCAFEPNAQVLGLTGVLLLLLLLLLLDDAQNFPSAA